MKRIFLVLVALTASSLALAEVEPIHVTVPAAPAPTTSAADQAAAVKSDSQAEHKSGGKQSTTHHKKSGRKHKK